MRHIHSIHAQNASDDCNLGETSDKLKLRELQQDNWPVHFKNVNTVEFTLEKVDPRDVDRKEAWLSLSSLA